MTTRRRVEYLIELLLGQHMSIEESQYLVAMKAAKTALNPKGQLPKCWQQSRTSRSCRHKLHKSVSEVDQLADEISKYNYLRYSRHYSLPMSLRARRRSRFQKMWFERGAGEVLAAAEDAHSYLDCRVVGAALLVVGVLL